MLLIAALLIAPLFGAASHTGAALLGLTHRAAVHVGLVGSLFVAWVGAAVVTVALWRHKPPLARTDRVFLSAATLAVVAPIVAGFVIASALR
ncbi:MAG: hypothetical protein EA397_17455 [Deltaproteobacteria bacterium]|nr:MAG: hypothetical protein EA397_17455 [Deltaproteobacteria bacterium]